MPRRWSWLHPRSLEEAAALLAEHGDEAMVVAGGTALCLSPPSKDRLALVDLGRVGAAEVALEADAAVLGAMVTPETLARSRALDRVGGGMLREVGAGIGPRPVRNRATVGGNVIRAFPWSDLPAPLLALGAEVELLGGGGARRRVSADELFASQPRNALRPGELLAAVRVGIDGPGRAGAFRKLASTAVDHALVSVAVTVTLEGDRCVEARVAAGALTALPQRISAVEDALVGRELDDRAIAEASAHAATARVSRDRRADDGYRLEVAAVLVRRALGAACARARGGVA